jgi:hypothetical protein
MLYAAIAYQVLQQENPQTIDKVTAVLEKPPSYATNGRRGFNLRQFIFFPIQPLKDFTLALTIIGNEKDVQKRERTTKSCGQ